MSWLSKALKGAAKVTGVLTDPILSTAVKKVSDNNPDNKIVNFLAPGENQVRQLDQGAPLNFNLLADPGNEFTPNQATKEAWAAPGQKFRSSQAALLGQRQLNLQNFGKFDANGRPELNYTPVHQNSAFSRPVTQGPMSGAPNNIQPGMNNQIAQAMALRQPPQMGIQPMSGSNY